jgi:hypothetical protein
MFQENIQKRKKITMNEIKNSIIIGLIQIVATGAIILFLYWIKELINSWLFQKRIKKEYKEKKSENISSYREG